MFINAKRGESFRFCSWIHMLIRIGFDIIFDLPAYTPMHLLLFVHPSRLASLRDPELLKIEPYVPMEKFIDSFGNTCGRIVAHPGQIRFTRDGQIEDDGLPTRLITRSNNILCKHSRRRFCRFCCQPILRSRSDERHRQEPFRQHTSALAARAGDFGLGSQSRHLWLSVCPQQPRPLMKFTANGGVSAGTSRILRSHFCADEHSRSICHRLSRRYRRTDFSRADGFQRLARSLSRRIDGGRWMPATTAAASVGS